MAAGMVADTEAAASDTAAPCTTAVHNRCRAGQGCSGASADSRMLAHTLLAFLLLDVTNVAVLEAVSHDCTYFAVQS
jgi:hypothetical protein